MSTKRIRRAETPVRVTMDNLEEAVRLTGRNVWDLCRIIKDAEKRGHRVYMSGGTAKVLRGIYSAKFNGDDT